MLESEKGRRPTAGESRRGGWRSSWWRWGISLAVFLFILRWIDLGGFRSALARLDWGPLLLAFICLTLALVLFRALRLWMLLRAQGFPLAYGKIFRIQWEGQFFGLLLPGTLGTDAWRVWAVSRTAGRMEGSVAAVAMDRVAGFVGQVLNALLAWFLFGGILSRREAGGLLLDVGLFSLAALATLGLLSSARVAGALTRLPLFRTPRVRKSLAGLQEGLGLLWRRSGRLPFLLGVATAGHFFHTLAVFALARGLGAAAGFGYYMGLVPLSLMATGLPISFSGLGVRDLTYVSLFQPLGVPAEIMLAVSVSEFALTILIRLIGGLFCLFPAGSAPDPPPGESGKTTAPPFGKFSPG
ncbi:MAG: flippase-like domain-containing protein [Candidatus Tectomicrobia bacterium]|nr:flippase-like domain-containing protein [Candidatus Tectomicrobia bacterium]